MIELCNRIECSGCQACVNSCPREAIRMKCDNEGFEYPYIDQEKCIGCGICTKTCKVLRQTVETKWERKAYAMINKDPETRKSSSSGGMFSILAKYVLHSQGIVFGAAFNEEYDVEHIGITKIEDLPRLCGSKYVQSKIGDIYKQAKKALEKGQMVLFTGTPCQIGGLRAYLQKDYEKLICQDLVCHGAPSPKLWRKYLNEIEVKKIHQISFRDKSDGWSKFNIRIQGENKEIKQLFYKNNYMRAFLKDISLRPSCYQCHFKRLAYQSDITLGDFWGIQEVKPSMSDELGTSLVLINTPKGEQVIDAVKQYTLYEEINLTEAVSGNRPAIEGAHMPDKRKVFFEQMDKMSFKALIKKYVKGSFLKRCIERLKRKITI